MRSAAISLAKLRVLWAGERGTVLRSTLDVREPLTCPCCDSTNVVVLWFKCDDCGAVTAEQHELPHAREKRDRRREPRD